MCYEEPQPQQHYFLPKPSKIQKLVILPLLSHCCLDPSRVCRALRHTRHRITCSSTYCLLTRYSHHIILSSVVRPLCQHGRNFESRLLPPCHSQPRRLQMHIIHWPCETPTSELYAVLFSHWSCFTGQKWQPSLSSYMEQEILKTGSYSVHGKGVLSEMALGEKSLCSSQALPYSGLLA